MNLIKRQKIPTARCEEPVEFQEDPENASIQEQGPRGYALDTLPPEVLEMILQLLPLQDVATSVRLVSRHCSMVAGAVLNGAFLAAGARLEGLTSCVDKTLKETRTDAELLGCSKALNALQLIKSQYKMLRAVTWRYTHPPTRHQRAPRICFYAGSLLDDLNDLLDRLVKYHASVVDSRDVYSCVACFVATCKRFMNFFEKISERRVNRSALISGCKIVDVLDCLVEGRQVVSFKATSGKRRSSNGTVNIKLRYVMRRAWFTHLDVTKNSKENSWRDEQRFMYLRLRRLVGSVNEHLFENLHYEHELLLQIPLSFPLRPPPASTYSGYGEYDGQFFYYGNMNKYAYESKFLHTVNPLDVTLNTEQPVQRQPSFDLMIEIELKCTSELAPLAIRTVLRSADEFEAYEARTTDKHQQLFLRMTVMCPASIANRLPGNFVWELRTPRRLRKNS
ncbi:hypothetical protein WN55_04135 [Dufourea novaeangliae]|uniref:F-box domain-containing protein n=1 Tax=Dufourea novaeangliae TaxID=178035 RepID=A0A154PLC5_DUFNO|nr:hypothetical protein WN55_04135 [Dufourea novaeangliae]